MEFQKSTIEIKKPIHSTAEGVVLDDDQIGILQNSFVSLVVGPPGSGKSYLLEQFITHPNLYLKRFNKILFIAPSVIGNLTSLMKSSNWNKNLNLLWLRESILAFENGYKGSTPINILVILDDVIGEINAMKHDPELVSFFYNRRHWLKNGWISIIITTQKYVLVPSSIRSVVTNIFCFKPNYIDWDRIKKETNILSSKQIDALFRIVYAKKHNFIYFKLDSSDVFFNFDKVVIS